MENNINVISYHFKHFIIWHYFMNINRILKLANNFKKLALHQELVLLQSEKLPKLFELFIYYDEKWNLNQKLYFVNKLLSFCNKIKKYYMPNLDVQIIRNNVSANTANGYSKFRTYPIIHDIIHEIIQSGSVSTFTEKNKQIIEGYKRRRESISEGIDSLYTLYDDYTPFEYFNEDLATSLSETYEDSPQPAGYGITFLVLNIIDPILREVNFQKEVEPIIKEKIDKINLWERKYNPIELTSTEVRNIDIKVRTMIIHLLYKIRNSLMASVSMEKLKQEGTPDYAIKALRDQIRDIIKISGIDDPEKFFNENFKIDTLKKYQRIDKSKNYYCADQSYYENGFDPTLIIPGIALKIKNACEEVYQKYFYSDSGSKTFPEKKDVPIDLISGEIEDKQVAALKLVIRKVEDLMKEPYLNEFIS